MFIRYYPLRRLLFLLSLVLIGVADQACADNWLDSYDAAEVTWQAAEETPAKVVKQQRVRIAPKGNRNGSNETIGAEHIVYECPPGISAWWWRNTPPAAVIDELNVRIDVRVNQPGTWLAGEVLLPRTIDPETDQPMRLIIRSAIGSISRPGDIELSLSELPRAVARAVRVKRVSPGSPSIDPKGAYLVRVGLVTPGAMQSASLWIKELQIAGLIRPQGESTLASDDSSGEDSDMKVVAGPAFPTNGKPPSETETSPGGVIETTQVTLGNEGFLIDGKPFFPRAWRYQGEAYSEIAKAGFNTLSLEQVPNETNLRQAALHGLKLICPAPSSETALETQASWAPVLAWTLLGKVGSIDLDTRLAQIEDIRSLPREAQRPIIVQSYEASNAWSRLADGLIVPSTGSLSSRESNSNSAMESVQLTSRPGTPLLATIVCDLGPLPQQQLDALIGVGVTPAWLPASDMSSAAHDALASGCRGILFSASESLDGVDEATLSTNRWLAALNAQLKLIEPWSMGPSSPEQLSRGSGYLKERDGIRLAIPRPFLAQPAEKIVLPGTGITSRLFRLTPAGIDSTPVLRVAGGMQVDRPSGYKPGFLVAANDPRIVASLRRYTGRVGPLLSQELVQFATLAIQRSDSVEAKKRTELQQKLGEAKLALARRDHTNAYDLAYGVIETIEIADQSRRRIAQQQQTLRLSSPLSILPATLTDHFGLMQIVGMSPRGPNRLFGGSFEDIDEARRSGWHRPELAKSEKATVELIDGKTIHGKRMLRLANDDPTAIGNRSPRIVSPAIALAAGEMIEITGWAQVMANPLNSANLLRVTDTLGGEELSLEIRSNESWQPFQIIRRTLSSTELRFSISVEGETTANIDGVMVRAIEPRKRRPSTTHSTATASSRSTQTPRRQTNR